ncbi:type II toxin-antitoxin system ParD family antitoxin [Dyadobacter koreensis]|uniref:type II toxin-antitoxin system ParD family antitoxin n=1 Tax=Dyadobacter koreensis TaxID=408657 RepID=UPI001E4ADEB3|nr:type II toxin-antitoxin system ParD family antitoxin [Dyadobacter koreensis]
MDNGRYTSAIEVVREGLRLLQEDEQRLKILRNGLVDGEESDWVETSTRPNLKLH